MSENFVVISGCSGGGKSTLLAELAARGHAVVEEPGRRIVIAEMEGNGTALPWVDPQAFARRAVAVSREDRARMAGLAGWVFFDRGLIDAAVALEASGGEAAAETVGGERYHRTVFMTPPWPEIFDGDAERRHGFDDAVAEYERLSVACPLLGYEVVEIPRIAVAERADFCSVGWPDNCKEIFAKVSLQFYIGSRTHNREASAMREISKIVPGPRQLKALTHPDRLKMLGLLRLEGPQTATSLAARLGLNSGATSYHLRQLAQHGFIEIEEGRGNKRDKWWRARHEATTYDSSEAEGEALDAGMAMVQSVISHHASQMQRAHENYPHLPLAWRKAQSFNDFTIPMSPEAAKGLVEDLLAILWKAKEAAPEPGAELPEGWRPFSVHLHGFPYMAEGRDEK